MIFTFSEFTLDIDVEKTKIYYNAANLVSKDCTCSGCRNYEQVVDLLPDEVLSFFSRLGIEMKKIREAYVNCTNADDTVFYGGFYLVCGSIIGGENSLVADSSNSNHWGKTHTITNDFKVSFHNDCSLLESNFPLPAIQLEISASMPWVLAEQNDYEKTQNP